MKTLTSDDIRQAIAWRHHLHRNPELAFEEHETSKFVAGKLAEWGFKVEVGLGKTGVVGTLSKGSSRRSIGLRADMDALPILEASGVDYASILPGRMHACGHDGHVSMLLAAAKALVKDDFDGTVHLIFQPAEENEGGAREMITGGLFRQFPVDAVYAVHNWPALDLGTCVARDDAMMAAFGTFEITVKGKGAHGAMPHEGADPVVAASAIVGGLQSVVSRNVSPLEGSVVSVTQMHGGDAWNVIPDRMMLRGTTRWFDDVVGRTLESRLKAISAAVASGYGCDAEVDYLARYPATINSKAEAGRVREVAARQGLSLLDAPPSMAAEDFAFMLREKPGCYFWLGSRQGDDVVGLHSPRYDFNDALIPIGVDMWRGLVAHELGLAGHNSIGREG